MNWKRVPKNWTWNNVDGAKGSLCPVLFSDEAEGYLCFGPLTNNISKGPGLVMIGPDHRYYISISDLVADFEQSVDDW